MCLSLPLILSHSWTVFSFVLLILIFRRSEHSREIRLCCTFEYELRAIHVKSHCYRLEILFFIAIIIFSHHSLAKFGSDKTTISSVASKTTKASIIFIKSIMISWICNFHFVKLVAHSLCFNVFRVHQFRYEFWSSASWLFSCNHQNS